MSLLQGLQDKTICDSITLHKGMDDSATLLYGADPLAPPFEQKVDYRLCDVYAHEISKLDGAPKCELYWPEKNRDEAVAACGAFLEKYGDNFQYDPNAPTEFGRRDDQWQHAHFSKLDHPATPEDVKAGRAIFSLPGSPRLVKLPDFPINANWTTLKDSPSVQSKGETTSIISSTSRREKFGRPRKWR